jgi:hypothetical protein
MRTRRKSNFRHVCIMSVVLAELILGRVPMAHAQIYDYPSGTTPTAPTFSESLPDVKPTAKAPVKTDSDDVNSLGALVHSIALKLPPGRSGAEPSLVLSYSSSSAEQVSAFGAGWSLPLSAIRRSTRFGTPKIAHVGNTYQYDDDFTDASQDVLPRYERDGTDLVISRLDQDSRGTVFRDHIDRTFSKSFFNPSTNSWQVIDKGGTTHLYGHVPGDSSVPEAVVRDELGTTQWQLVRSIDPWGNAVDYQYAHGPARTDLTQPQFAPLPATISYGKNLTTGAPHFASVTFNYISTPSRILLDHAHGHVYLDRVISNVVVRLLQPSAQTVRTYSFSVLPSATTGRYLLKSVQEQAPGLQMPAMSFGYTENGGKKPQFTAGPLDKSAIDANVLRDYPSATRFPNQPGWVTPFQVHNPWPTEWTSLGHGGYQKMLLSPPGIASAFRFEDLDGDGATDILYHPNFVAGFGIAEPWETFKQTAPAQWTRWDQAFASDPLSMLKGASDYADVDRDGVVDRLQLLSRPSGLLSGAQGAATDSALASLCQFLFELGVFGSWDPIPFRQLMAIWSIDQVAALHGFRTAEWVQAIDTLIRELLAESMSGLGNEQVLLCHANGNDEARRSAQPLVRAHSGARRRQALLDRRRRGREARATRRRLARNSPRARSDRLSLSQASARTRAAGPRAARCRGDRRS